MAGIGAGPGSNARGSAGRVLEGRRVLLEAGGAGGKKLCFVCDLAQDGVRSQHSGDIEYKQKSHEYDRKHQCGFDEGLSSGATAETGAGHVLQIQWGNGVTSGE